MQRLLALAVWAYLMGITSEAIGQSIQGATFGAWDGVEIAAGVTLIMVAAYYAGREYERTKKNHIIIGLEFDHDRREEDMHGMRPGVLLHSERPEILSREPVLATEAMLPVQADKKSGARSKRKTAAKRKL